MGILLNGFANFLQQSVFTYPSCTLALGNKAMMITQQILKHTHTCTLSAISGHLLVCDPSINKG